MCYYNTVVRREKPLFISTSILTEARKFRNKIFHQSENLFQSRRWEHATIIRWKRYPRSPLSAEIISWYSSRLNSWYSRQLQANPPKWNGFRWRVCSTDRAGKQAFREVKATVSVVFLLLFFSQTIPDFGQLTNYHTLVSEANFFTTTSLRHDLPVSLTALSCPSVV